MKRIGELRCELENGKEFPDGYGKEFQMTIRLLDRVSTLLRADAHGMVDALEERSLLLRQHLRDAELEILQKRARTRALGEEEERLGKEAERRSQETRALDEDVNLALASGKDDLARFAVGRFLSGRRELESVAVRQAEARAAREKLEEELSLQEERFESLRSAARARLAAAQTSSAWEDGFEPRVGDEEIDLELLRRQRQEGV